MADSQDAATYVEAITLTVAQVQAGVVYLEAASTLALGEIRLSTSYVEIITPAKPAFIGWGTPLGTT
jgi:hypothetical protein